MRSANYEHPKPAHRPPDGHMWDAKAGTWVPDPEAAPKRPKAAPPKPPGPGASDDDRRDWLRDFSAFDGIAYIFPNEYRKAYRKATRPADDGERRVKQRRESTDQQRVDRLGHAERKAKKKPFSW